MINSLKVGSALLVSILFSKLLSERGIPLKKQGVPAVVIGDVVIVGDKAIIDNFVIEADQLPRAYPSRRAGARGML